jgi:hypothetical protein
MLNFQKQFYITKNLYQTTPQIIHIVSFTSDYGSIISAPLVNGHKNIIMQTRCIIKNKYADGTSYLSSNSIRVEKNIQRSYLNNFYSDEISSFNQKK